MSSRVHGAPQLTGLPRFLAQPQVMSLMAFVSVHDILLATLLLIPMGLALNAPSSVTVVMGQEYLPNRVAA